MKLPKSYYNLLSFSGSVVALISLLIMAFLAIVSYYFDDMTSYLGLFIYIVFPVFLVIGLLLIPIGMFISKRKLNKSYNILAGKSWPVIDMNEAKYRNAFIVFSFGTVIFIFLSGIGSYKALHYSESVQFCGLLCHQVMEPEYVAYQNSSHAKVTCAECHVGDGADWFVRSKLSGLRQVKAVITGDYSRPINTPIKHLRPAQETCEKCHWPEKFYSHKTRYFKHFLSDSLNTEWNIALQMKIGGEHSVNGLTEGIHWHINPNVKIEYIPKRDNRKDIKWVRYTNLETGKVIVYQDTIKPLKKKKLEAAVPRLMDCMDCHNRPSHHFLTPMEFIDNALISGKISKDLPFIKKIAMDVLKDPYESQDSAMHHIANIFAYYQENHPEFTMNKDNKVTRSISAIQEEFSKHIFPSMNASWDVYPNHLGHKVYKGCFRCHSGFHVSESGKSISNECNLCHNLVLQGENDKITYAPINDNLEFQHPIDINKEWVGGSCVDCHRYLY